MPLSSLKSSQELFHKDKKCQIWHLWSRKKQNPSEFPRGWWSPWANYERFQPQEFRKSTTSGDIWGHSVCSDQVVDCNSQIKIEYAKSVYFAWTGPILLEGRAFVKLNWCFSSVFRRNQPAVFPAQDDSRLVDGILRHRVCQLCIFRKRDQVNWENTVNQLFPAREFLRLETRL